MARLIYLTHPQVQIDPAVPVPQWGLSAEGRARAEALAPRLSGVGRVVSSREVKAMETAEILGGGRTAEAFEDLGENDRSATGVLPGPAVEAMADRFFAAPEESAEGWERAVDVQARVVARVQALIAEPLTGDLLVCGHGAAGTLLYCHLAGLAIDRRHDQLPGGGCFFAAELPEARPAEGWRRMEDR